MGQLIPNFAKPRDVSDNLETTKSGNTFLMKVTTLERLIATAQFLLATFILWFTIDSFKTMICFLEKPPYYGGQNVTNMLLFRTYHFDMLFSVISIVSSIGLVFQKKWGWISSIIVWFTYSIVTIISISRLALKKPNWDISEIGFWAFLPILFSVIGYLLITSRFKEKYKPSQNIFITIITVIIVLSLDKLLIHR